MPESNKITVVEFQAAHLPIPIFRPPSILFECVQMFFYRAQICKFIRYNLTFDHGQKNLTVLKNIELADGIHYEKKFTKNI